jgi:hypothetical protein
MLAVALLTIVAVSYHHRRLTPILPLAIGQTASTRLRSSAEKAPNPPRQNTGSVQIPIAPDALPSHIFRGFLLWRFAYAGPRCAPRHLHGPPSANLHRSGHSIASSVLRTGLFGQPRFPKTLNKPLQVFVARSSRDPRGYFIGGIELKRTRRRLTRLSVTTEMGESGREAAVSSHMEGF